jgi:hypothetical protein
LRANKYITANCIIDQGTVFKNGEKLFENKSAGASGFLLSIYQQFQLSYPKFYKMDNLSKLGWLASEVLLKDSFTSGNYQPEKVGLILANHNSSLDNDIRYYDTVKNIASPALFVYTLPNIVIGEISIRNNFKGEHAFYLEENFDADFIEKQVSYLLDQDILQACICGWVDILNEQYKAVLFLIEKQESGVAVRFSAENMKHIFEKNG